ncbi:MAG: hypothetical protein ACWGSQ_04715 [Longimicrobiales bacterium]
MTDFPDYLRPGESDEDDELPILPDSEYEESRKTLTGREPAEVEAEAGAGASEEQMLYARILAAGMYVGLGLLLVTFGLYATGLIPAAVPIEELPNYWTLSAHEYLEAINHEFLHREALVLGWGWIAVLNKGDFLNFIGIAVLAAVTVICYLGILPSLFRKRDWIYGTIALLEVIVLVLAASGIVSAGH